MELAFFGAVTSVAALFDLNFKEEMMEEKILIKSRMNKTIKSLLLVIPSFLIGIAALSFLILLYVKPGITSYSHYKEYGSWNYKNGYDAAFYELDEYFIIFIIACSLLVLGLTSLIIYWASSKCELTITENNVKGKALFGKEVVLPLYMISSYSTRKFLSTISVATASGSTKFALIENYADIAAVLSSKIKERQQNVANASTLVTTPQSNAIDDLKKLKDLLDAGIITQEEFNAKIKQLLGL